MRQNDIAVNELVIEISTCKGVQFHVRMKSRESLEPRPHILDASLKIHLLIDTDEDIWFGCSH